MAAQARQIEQLHISQIQSVAEQPRAGRHAIGRAARVIQELQARLADEALPMPDSSTRLAATRCFHRSSLQKDDTAEMPDDLLDRLCAKFNIVRV